MPPNHYTRLFLLLLSFPTLLSFSQSPYLGSTTALAEKIYLQLDTRVYTTDETIWFKAIVTSAADHVPSALSMVLYVELIDPGEKILEKKLIKIENGTGAGFFQLDTSYAEGSYLIRGYTQWDRNFGRDFFFNEYIRVFSPAKKANAEPIKNIILTEEQNKEQRLTATLVMPYEYSLIPNIPPEEVKSFEIIEGAKNFMRLYCEVYPEGCPYAPATGDIIAIYTQSGKGLYGASRTVGLLKAAVPVFSAPREFYAPKYETREEKDRYKPDLRALIFWKPDLLADSTGTANVSFYNADNTGEMEVVVEAISGKGEIGYRELEYEVRKREE